LSVRLGSGGSGASSFGLGGAPFTRQLVYVTVAVSIAAAIATGWMGYDVAPLFGMTPSALVGGSDALPHVPALWQLVTYPFFVLDPIALVLGVIVYGWWSSDLERQWGRALYVERWATLVIGVAAIDAAFAIAWPALRGVTVFGPTALLEGLVVAWGLTFPTRTVRIWLVLPITGRALAWIAGGIVVLVAVFGGPDAALASIPALASVGLAVAMVRWDLSLRRLWLLHRRRAIQRELDRIRRDGLH
jgi:hypothetical protein